MAKCYVGTYGKYNAGSLSGKWLDLSDYATYQDFVKACHEVHKNEHDPEFMIQDWENLPDGFPGVEWIGENDFNDIKAAMGDEEKESVRVIDYSEKAFALVGDTRTIKDKLKALGGRFNAKLSCGAGWIFPKSKMDAVQAFLGGGQVTKNEPKQAKDEALWDEYKKRIIKAEGERDLDYYMKSTSDIMMLDCGVILVLKKPSIKVDFCWADEGPSYDEYKRVHSTPKALEEYFIEENMKDYDDIIERLTTRKDRCGFTLVPVLFERSTYNHGNCGWGYELYVKSEGHVMEDEQDPRTRDCIHRLTESDCKKVLAILKEERAKFEKRLHTYLKRYGTGKLHTWTYWQDA